MFHQDIKKITLENDNFRKVVYTGENSQLVLMSIPEGEEIGEETHKTVDQILFLVEGQGEAILNDVSAPFLVGEVVCVPAGTKHNFKNNGSQPLKIYTVYSPPEHKDGTVHKTKEDAQKDKDDEYQKAETSPADPLENM